MKATRIWPALLLALVLLVCLPLGALAATGTQDGLAVTLTTDKAAYAAGEDIVARATVRNNNPIAVHNVRLEVLLPSGLTLQSGGGSTGPVTLAAGESASVALTASPKGGDAIPPTGDDSPLGPLLLLALLAGGGALLLRALERRSAGRFFALLLCGVLACGVLAPAPAGAATEARRFSVGENITAGGVGYGLTATVSYDWETGPVPPVPPVPVPVTGVTLDKPTLWLGTFGAPGQLTATVLPANAANKNIIWASSDTAVATVSAAGLVTPLSPGTARITVTTADGGKTAFCDVTVAILVTGVTVSPGAITGWDMDSTPTQSLYADVRPANATDRRVDWTTSDAAIATVDQNGLVTARGTGNCRITATTVDGGFTDTCDVTIGSTTASNAEAAKLTGFIPGTNTPGTLVFEPVITGGLTPGASMVFGWISNGLGGSMTPVGVLSLDTAQVVDAANLLGVVFRYTVVLNGVSSFPMSRGIMYLFDPGTTAAKLREAKALLPGNYDGVSTASGVPAYFDVKRSGAPVTLPAGVGINDLNGALGYSNTRLSLGGTGQLRVYIDFSPGGMTLLNFSYVDITCDGTVYRLPALTPMFIWCT